jgi:lipopolysaccharide export system protein LptA
MRRISVFLALAAILLTLAVAYTYKLRAAKTSAHVIPTPDIDNSHVTKAQGWQWQKDDPENNRPVVRVTAQSFQGTNAPSTFDLTGVALRLYNKEATTYTYVRSAKALFDEGSGIMKSDGAVFIVMNVPSDKDAEDQNQIAKLVRVQTSGVTYETKSGKATTDQPASFEFSDGGGKAVGAEYDPTKHELHLKSQIALDWTGGKPLENALHVEAGDLVYKELEQKVYLSPWSKLKRMNTTIQAENSVVTLVDGKLNQVEGVHAFGTDDRDDRHQDYSGDKMTAFFNEDGVMVNLIAEQNARIASTQTASRTTVTADKADLRFAVQPQPDGAPAESDLHLVLAEGHATATSTPLPQPNVLIAETRILRSEHIELEMKPGGKNVQEIRTPMQGQLEFKPNREMQAHRILDASRLRILYGANNDIETFLAWNASTHTDKPITAPPKDGKPPVPPPPALTWSDELVAKFAPNTNQLATIEQTGNFRYQEGVRRARSKKAFLEQNTNKITLTETAHIWDDTGSTLADKILMDQQTGDIDALGHVVSTREPDKNTKPGTSMLDDKQPMQARADLMQNRENNVKVHYQGHAVLWQGANRISADVIDIDRDEQTVHAAGSVVSELVDNKSDDKTNTAAQTAPIFTIVRAPEMLYADDKRLAHYTGNVKLVRDKMTVTSTELRAFLTPKTDSNSDDSSLDHAYADGNVVVFNKGADRTRTGTSEHCEYYPKQSKVVLNGGLAKMVDSVKGTTKGRQLTYYSDDDRLIVEGQKNELAFTQMNKK